VKRKLKKISKITSVSIVGLALAYFFPIPIIAFVLCGVCDVSRNRGLDTSILKQYFFKNGITTWLASPLNILLDILALPYLNKGVYNLADLPVAYQDEIGALLRSADELDLVGRLHRQTAGLPRVMYFFKWYGRNVESDIEIPDFHVRYKYVRTIGVSMFRGHESTSRHFGPFRPSLRILYCLNNIKDKNSYIKVGPVENHWKDNRLFIFDDTLLHQSFNKSDDPRYVLFVDILRPSHLNFVFDFAVTLIRVFFKGFNGIFYKNWKLLNN
jgi:aspartyl/asparaginyl beta-hydroxylase (cupin superfamily)